MGEQHRRRRPLATLATPAALWLVTCAALSVGLIGDGLYDLIANLGIGLVVAVSCTGLATR